MTGTPVQNRLEDIVALLRFLRIQPYEGTGANAVFQQQVTDSIISNPHDPCKYLRELLKTICLRRTCQPGSKLSSSQVELRWKLSPSERVHYDAILEQGRRDLDLHVSTKQLFQKYTRLFTIMLRLRIFCNSGAGLEMVKSPDSISEIPNTSDDMIASPSNHALSCDTCDTLEVYEMIGVQESCPTCGRLLPLSSETGESEPSDRPTKRQKLSELDSDVLNIKVQRLFSDTLKVVKNDDGDMTGYFPTKLSAVAGNILQQAPLSKRSVCLGGSSRISTLICLQHRIFILGKDFGFACQVSPIQRNTSPSN